MKVGLGDLSGAGTHVTSGYLCNLILPGAAKSGTSSLHDLLDQHPDICMSKPKEPQHFSFDDLYARGPERHNALFARTGANYYGESSQCYMVHEQAIRRIARDLRDPKIVFVLRDPVARLVSHYRWNFRLTFEKAPLMTAIRERGLDVGYAFDRGIGMYHENGAYIAASRYTEWIPKWQAAFGRENVLLLRTEDLKRDPQRVLDRCFAFLGLERHILSGTVERNTTESTFRLPPMLLRAVERRMPPRLRWNRHYQGLRRRLLEAATPEPPGRLTDAEERAIRSMLADDLAFHAALEPA